MSTSRTWEKYQQAYQAADEATKQLLDSSVIPDCVGKALQEQGSASALQRDAINIFAHHVLGNLSQLETVQQLDHSGISHAVDVYFQVQTCITGDVQKQSNNSDLQSEIAATEAALRSVDSSPALTKDSHTNQEPTTSETQPIPPNNPSTSTDTEEPTHFSNQADLLDYDPAPATKRPPPTS